MTTETIGQKLRRLRMRRNISQDQLAEALNTTRQTVSNWENDKCAIDYFDLKDIQKILGTSWDELMSDDFDDKRRKEIFRENNKTDGEKYCERSRKNGHVFPYTDIANLTQPGDITITADDLRIAYSTAYVPLIHIAVAIEAKNIGFTVLDIDKRGFRIKLKDADEVKAFKQYLDKLFISMDYEHAPRFQLISRKYWQEYEETTNEISKKAIRELYGLKGDQIYCVTEPHGYSCGYADSEEGAKKMAAKLGIKDYKITLV